MAKIRQKPKRFTLAQQQFALRAKYGKAIASLNIKRNTLYCDIRIKPTSESTEYMVSLEYKSSDVPKVYLRNQGLLKSAEDRPPHLYECKYYSEGNEKLRLCLYLPGNNEWNSGMMVADTFIPWATEWLYYYELWRMTGEWLGGGHDGKKD